MYLGMLFKAVCYVCFPTLTLASEESQQPVTCILSRSTILLYNFVSLGFESMILPAMTGVPFLLALRLVNNRSKANQTSKLSGTDSQPFVR